MTPVLKERLDLASRRSIAAYDLSAKKLADLYESTKFENVHAEVLDLLPSPGSSILDVGSGSGRDAAALAQMGYRVVAVEPSAGLRAEAKMRHLHPSIFWVDDALPELNSLARQSFKMILVSAVWMHVAPEDRPDALRRLSDLLETGGCLVISLRIGPEDALRGISSVDPAAVIAIAKEAGLRVTRRGDVPDALGRPEIKWVVLALTKT